MRNNKLEYYFVWMKTTTHSGSNSFSQVDYIFTTAKSLSIVVFIIKFMFVEQFKYGKCSHYWSLFSFALNNFFFASSVTRCTSQNQYTIDPVTVNRFLFLFQRLNTFSSLWIACIVSHSKAKLSVLKLSQVEQSLLCMKLAYFVLSHTANYGFLDLNGWTLILS